MKSSHAALRFALSEARGSWRTLFSFSAAIFIGIAAMTFARALNSVLTDSVSYESRRLLGADIMLTSRDSLPNEVVERSKTLADEVSTEVRFRTMVRRVESEQMPTPRQADLSPPIHLAMIRAFNGAFPFYGELVTEPSDAWNTVYASDVPMVVVDESLFKKIGLSVGDLLDIGGLKATVAGFVTKVAGDVSPMYAFAPRIFTLERYVPRDTLLARGAIADYYLYAKFQFPNTLERFLLDTADLLTTHRIESTTVEDRKELLGAISKNLTSFFGLVGVVALFLGGLGAVTTLSFYLRQKRPVVAILKCLGAPRVFTMRTFAIQVGVAALFASSLGSTFGVVTAWLVPQWLGDYLPISLQPRLALEEIAMGALIGTGALLLLLYPALFELSRSTPLEALRPAELSGSAKSRTLFPILILVSLSLGVLATDRLTLGLLAGGGVSLSLGLLYLISRGVRRFIRRLPLANVTFPIRYALKNLDRPGNQTSLLLISFGLGTMLLSLVLIVHHLMRSQTESARASDRPTAFIVDIQADQRASIRAMLLETDVSLSQEAAIVLMRLSKLRDQSVETLLSDPDSSIPKATLNREYWSTYRGELLESETVVEGTWIPEVEPDSAVIPVSIERKFMRRLGLSLGDSLEVVVAGLPTAAQITSVRDILWERLERNSFLVFPEGSLTNLPHFYVFGVRTESAEETAELMKMLARQFPNVSIFDVRSAIDTVEEVLGYISYVLGALALLVLLVALVTLLSVLAMSRNEREREVALLRTIGARTSVVARLVITEYVVLASIGALIGVAMACLLAIPISSRLLRATYTLPFGELILAFVALPTLVALSVWSSRRQWARASPAATLRGD